MDYLLLGYSVNSAGLVLLLGAVLLNPATYCGAANFHVFVLHFKFTFYEALDSLKFGLHYHLQNQCGALTQRAALILSPVSCVFDKSKRHYERRFPANDR